MTDPDNINDTEKDMNAEVEVEETTSYHVTPTDTDQADECS